jgi:nuclear pore complex protein Nup50
MSLLFFSLCIYTRRLLNICCGTHICAGGEDEDYEPPKVEVREIKEDGAVYTQRCKLFYQKDGQWVDRGVGNIHIKPTDSGKAQLIVRADTNLGELGF